MLLLTNDDGIEAEGLAALEAAARERSDRVVVVAPAEPHSGCGHRVTVDRPLQLEQVGEDRYRVDGTPADCVRLAVATLNLPPPVWVLSGINAGGNLGVDIHHSGTVAAAREAALHRWPAIALSHYHRRGEPIDWQVAAAWVDAVLNTVEAAEPLEAGAFFNVNLPHLVTPQADQPPEIVSCPIDPSPLPLEFVNDADGWQYRGCYQDRPRQPGNDVAICFGGQIALSRGRVV
jgi:5'-nucleotidase